MGNAFKIKNPREGQFNFHTENVDQDFVSHLPVYLNNRRQDFQLLESCLAKADFLEIKRVCHRILGSAQTFGLNQLHEIMEQMQQNARDKDLAGVKVDLINLGEYLQSALI